MVKLLQTLITYKLKQPKTSQNNAGFTLIELLVGLVLSLLVILPLLGFMVNMLQTDRQEQAKASSEQEIQSALSYIARDLEQAVYIYDGAGVDKIKAGLPIPANTNSVPVLVFWKRQFVPDVIPTGGSKNDDGFTYALVAYYLETTPQAACTPTNTWSCTAQITRLLVRGAVTGRDGQPIPNSDRAQPDKGFKLFNPTTDSASLEDIMNAWTPDGTIENKPVVLLDY
ncbi:MAG TPA: hormogonium polysaccharide secretion pseudopilin HpsC, partial [Stenomitos sp.]